MTSLRQKLLASTVNCTIVLMLSLPFYELWPTYWKAISVAMCFAYHMIFRQRCAGLVIAKAYNSKPVSITYAALYSLGWSTVLYSVVIPLDLLLCYGTAQALSVGLTGNPLPAWLTGSQTLDERSDRRLDPDPIVRNRNPVDDWQSRIYLVAIRCTRLKPRWRNPYPV